MLSTSPGTIDWRAAMWAGLIGSAAYVVIEAMLDVLLEHGVLVRQVRMTAGLALGEGVLDPARAVDAPVILTALAIHLALSIAYAVVLAWLIARLDFGGAEIVGFAFGLFLYLVNYYGFAQLFSWFAESRGGLSVVTHLAFGGVVAMEYRTLARPLRSGPTEASPASQSIPIDSDPGFSIAHHQSAEHPRRIE